MDSIKTHPKRQGQTGNHSRKNCQAGDHTSAPGSNHQRGRTQQYSDGAGPTEITPGEDHPDRAIVL